MSLKNMPSKYSSDVKKAVNLLRNEGCGAVFLFGSAVTGKIHKNSDLNIGVSGLPPKRFFGVHASLDKKLSNSVDLVDFDLNKDFYSLLESLGEVVRVG